MQCDGDVMEKRKSWFSDASESSSLESWQRSYIQQQMDKDFWLNALNERDAGQQALRRSSTGKSKRSSAREESSAHLQVVDRRNSSKNLGDRLTSGQSNGDRRNSSKSGSLPHGSWSADSHLSGSGSWSDNSASRKGSKETRLWKGLLRADPSLYETTDRESIAKVFLELQDPVDHEILTDRVPLALEHLGYEDVDEELVGEISRTLAHDRSFLEKADFEKAVIRYRDARLDNWCREFQSLMDPDGSMSFETATALLAEKAIITVPGLLQQLLLDVNGVPSEDVTAADYVRICELVQYRGGFSNREVEEARHLFVRYDANSNMTMETKELSTALRWLGYKVRSPSAASDDDRPRSPAVEALLTKAKVEAHSITFQAFLHVMRHHREAEILEFKDDFAEVAGEGGAVDLAGVVDFLHEMDFITATELLVKEIIEDVGIQGEQYPFADVYMIYRHARQSEGFRKAELEEFKEAFVNYDTNNSGAVDVVELGGVLRWLGYHVTVEMQQDLLYEVDVDKSGELDFDEFLKILRWYKEEELRQLEQAFITGDEDESGCLNANEIKSLLAGLGFFPLSTDQSALVKEQTLGKELDFRACCDMMDQLRAIARDKFRQTHGFEPDQTDEFRSEFERCDVDSNGYIAQREIVHLFEKYCPKSVEPAQARKVFTDMLSQVDEDGDGKFNFKEFLHLMRLLQDRADYDTVLEEQEAAQKAGFSRDEIKDLRKVFKICDSDASSELEVDELVKALSMVTKMSYNMKEQVKKIFQEVDTDGSHTLDFNEFLFVMRRVQDAHIYEPGK